MLPFTKPHNWDQMVSSVNTIQGFEAVARAVFEDGKVTLHRLMVLEVFTRDVVKTHPEIGPQAWRCFQKISMKSEDRYKWLCFTHSKYDYPTLLRDVVEGLLSLFL